MNRSRLISSVTLIALAALACNLPQASAPVAPPVEVTVIITNTAAPLAPGAPSETFTAVPSAIPPTGLPTATACSPTVTASSSINVRSGPGTVYTVIGSMSVGGTATVAGKSNDGTWYYINFPGGSGGYGWVSGSVVSATCIPSTLAVIAAPPTPLPVSGTCRDGYTWRLITPSDKICVTPAAKAQAEADNAAANSRKIVNVYGMDACISGYVWREAYSGDVVCVTPATRGQAASDNAAAAARWVVGAYGPHTCIAGYVWREARPGDDVCVTGAVRTQTAADNAAAASRKAVNVYGVNACISGYVWREAFAGDYVCVTPAVKSQVAADNAAAPSHTWP